MAITNKQFRKVVELVSDAYIDGQTSNDELTDDYAVDQLDDKYRVESIKRSIRFIFGGEQEAQKT